jgi:hypothetical protein
VTILRYMDVDLATRQPIVRSRESTAEEDNRDTINARVEAALAANKTYLALANPTNAQVVAQVNRLTLECSALIRLLLSRMEATD